MWGLSSRPHISMNMRSLKRITTKNIQSHKEVVIDLPETGLIRFSGDNSNGKSVITKFTSNLISGFIGSPKVRNTLISDSAMFGEVLYESYDGYKLLCHIQRDAAGTFLELTRPNNEVVKRYAADKQWSILTSEFGFFYDRDLEVTLQIVDDDSPMLYLSTPPKSTYALINSAIADPVAEKSLENMKNLYDEALSKKQELVKQKNVYQDAMTQFVVYDVDDLSAKLEKIEKFIQVLSGIYVPELPDMPYLTPVNFYNVYKPNIPEFPYMKNVKFYSIYVPNIVTPVYPTLYEVHVPDVPDATNLITEIRKLQSGVCPVCGRPMVQGGIAHAC